MFARRNTPAAYHSLPAKEKDEKEQKVFDDALDRLDMYWDGKVHDGFQISSRGVTRSEHGETTSRYEITKKMFQSSMKGICDNEQLSFILEEWKYLSKHMDQRYGFVCFSKGIFGNNECECLADKVRAMNVSKLPTGNRWLFPSITLDPECPVNYMAVQPLSRNLAFSNPD